MEDYSIANYICW